LGPVADKSRTLKTRWIPYPVNRGFHTMQDSHLRLCYLLRHKPEPPNWPAIFFAGVLGYYVLSNLPNPFHVIAGVLR
jgi:hypothetical protein